MKYKTHILFLIFPSISLLYCIFYSLYIYDGYHFGLIFSNAVELNNEKIPYKEIFIESYINGSLQDPEILVDGKIFNKNSKENKNDIRKVFQDGINSLVDKLLKIEE